MNYTAQPKLFHLGKDPGEKYPIKPSSQEYKVAMETIAPIVAKHKAELIPGDPQLNYCDNALQNWAPQGCEALNECLTVPFSNRQRCYWPH